MAAKKLFDPGSEKPFGLSRTKVELFQDCPRCFYLDRRLGIARPAGFPFNLNAAVDALLKAEFDRYRSEGEPHPLMTGAGINAVPHAHPQLEEWRNNFRGVRTVHEQSNFELFGAILQRMSSSSSTTKPRRRPPRCRSTPTGRCPTSARWSFTSGCCGARG